MGNIPRIPVMLAIMLLVMVVPIAADEYQCGRSDVVLVLDRSGSMSGSPLAAAKTAAKTFVDLLNFDNDTAASASFATSASLEQGLTDDAALVKTAIDSVSASGLTCISCGINIAQAELDANGRGDSKQVIILLSDGVPSESYATVLAAADAAKAKGTILFTIGIGGADPTLMEDIASDPSFFSYGDPEDLDDIYTELADQLCGLPGGGSSNEVPEFGILAALAVLGLAGVFIARKRQ